MSKAKHALITSKKPTHTRRIALSTGRRMAVDCVDATEALINEIVDTIFKRPVTELSHLTDLALVEELDDIHRDEFDRSDKATTLLSRAILRLAGIPQSTSSTDAVYKQVARAHKTTEGHVA